MINRQRTRMKQLNAIDGVILPPSEAEVMSAVWPAYEKRGGAPVTTRGITACAQALDRLSEGAGRRCVFFRSGLCRRAQ